MKLPRFATLLLLARICSIASAEPPAPVLHPFAPAELLAILPAAPTDWTLTRSDADTGLGEWLFTKATRIFQAPPPPGTDPANPPPPGEVRLSVVDTAGFAPSLAAFADFKPEKSGSFERKFLGALPAIVVTGEQGRQFTQVLVSARYIVEITVTNLPQQRAEDWLRGLHFDALPPPNPTPAARPGQFRLSHVDELQPEKNRSYLVAASDSKRLEEVLKSLPSEKTEP